MIKQKIYLEKYDWSITVFYAVTHYDKREILKATQEVGANIGILYRVCTNLNNTRNSGDAYSNFDKRKSVMVIGRCDEAEQYMDSIVHEIGHVATHILFCDGINPYSEEPQYIAGEIARLMYPKAKKLLCPDCLEHLRASLSVFRI